jgi:hypothetical protein
MHWGGIRHRVFGTKNGLTKAALIRADRGMELFVYWHHVRGGAVAEFTAVLLHYPFVATFAAKVADAVATGRYGANTSRQYRAYWREITGGDGVVLRGPDASQLGDLRDLLEIGFLVAGSSFTAWREAHPGTSAMGDPSRDT